METCAEWARKFPLAVMKKQSWLSNTRDQKQLANELLSFFGIANPARWDHIYIQQREVSVAFRASLAHVAEPEALSVWLRKGQLDAQKSELQDFDKSAFRNSIPKARELAYLQPHDFAHQLQELCFNCGVALIYTPKLPKAPISGATRWLGPNPIIQLSDRYKTNDRFWFTFFHEAGHILLHGKKDVFLEGLDINNTNEEKEKEADQFAANWLIPSADYDRMLTKVKTTKDLEAFAKEIKMHPGVIIGRLQHEKVIHFSELNEYKVKIELFK